MSEKGPCQSTSSIDKDNSVLLKRLHVSGISY